MELFMDLCPTNLRVLILSILFIYEDGNSIGNSGVKYLIRADLPNL